MYMSILILFCLIIPFIFIIVFKKLSIKKQFPDIYLYLEKDLVNYYNKK